MWWTLAPFVAGMVAIALLGWYSYRRERRDNPAESEQEGREKL